MKIGIDIGGVCSYKSDKYESETEEMKEIINVKDCVNSLYKLKENNHMLYIVSFCGKKRVKNTREQIELLYNGLFTDMFFVKNKLKKNQILKYCGMDIMIDDTISVIGEITDMPESHIIHYTENIKPKKLEKIRKCHSINRVESDSWNDLVERIPEQIDISKILY